MKNCPLCADSLCSHFNKEFGYFDFIGDSTPFYWGEVSQEDARLINENAIKNGWKKTIEDFFHNDQKIFEYLLSPLRLDWFFWVYKQESKKVLDVGSGWGTLSFSLSEIVDEVWSVEAVKERIEFQAIRKKQERKNNVHLVRSWNYPLPFPDDSFDLVVVNGVLEWIGVLGDEDPRETQKKFLIEINRILKPNGILYIGIENRWGIQYFLGFPDHTDIRFTSLLPRRIANFVMQWKKAKNPIAFLKGTESGYRTYTYGYKDYTELLTKSGFRYTRIYWTIPDYNRSYFSGDIFSSEGFKFLVLNVLSNSIMETRRFSFVMACLRRVCSKKFLNIFLSFGLHRIFAPAFLIFASKSMSFQEGSLCETIFKDSSDVLRISSSHITMIDLQRGTSFKINRFPWEREKIEKEAVNPTVKGMFFNSHERTIFSSQIIYGRKLKSDELYICGEWLRDFQSTRIKGAWTPREYIDSRDKTIFNAFTLIGMSCDKVIETIFQNLPMKKVPQHGDFTLDNIFMDENNEIKVIDWEHYREEGSQWFDLVTLILGVLLKEKNLPMKEFLWSKDVAKLLASFGNTADEFTLQQIMIYMPMAMAIIITQELNWQAGRFNRDFMPRILSRVEEYKNLS